MNSSLVSAVRPLLATPGIAPATTLVDHAVPLVVPSALRRAAVAIGDVLGAVGLALCLPFVIIAVGMPIALGLRFLLWLVGML